MRYGLNNCATQKSNQQSGEHSRDPAHIEQARRPTAKRSSQRRGELRDQSAHGKDTSLQFVRRLRLPDRLRVRVSKSANIAARTNMIAAEK